MGKALEKDVEKNAENQKFHAVLLIAILILLFILAFVIKLSNDKKQEIMSVVDNNESMVNEKIENDAEMLESITDKEDKTETEENKVEDNKSDSKIAKFTKEVVDNLDENECIELVKIIDNKDNTVTLNLRKYKKADIPELTEEQYNELIKNNEIEIEDEIFTYNPRVNVLTNSKYVSFELDKENKKLESYPMTIFYVATDEYYTITCASDLKVYNDIYDDAFETILQYANKRKQGDFNMLSISTIPEYVFNNKDELERINVIF